MPTLHALLIAINNYHPESGVTPLAGCINDRNAMKRFLEKKYADLNPQITTLTDRTATRKNIIQHFRSALSEKAKAGDQILFYYSGHGSTATSASAFAEFDGMGQDETLVCYDSRLPDNHDLTDKELAVLLSEIKMGVHTVVIVDACHSASITRSAFPIRNPLEDPAAAFNLGKRRFTNSRSISRDLTSYLLDANNYYVQQGGNISIPRTKHLVFAACDRNEEAWETLDNRGLFTKTLLTVLDQSLNVSYKDLFARVRMLVYNVAKNQQPTLYPYEGFDPNALFLRPTVKPNLDRHQIKQAESGEWRMELGAINGLPTKPLEVEKLLIGIYEGMGIAPKYLGTTLVEHVLITELTLKFEDFLKAGKTYWGEVQSLPTSLLFNVTGRKSSQAQFIKIYDQNPSPFIQFLPKLKTAKYTVHCTKTKLKVFLTATKALIAQANKINEQSVAEFVERLEHIADWENIATLSNDASNLKDKVEVQFLEEISRGNYEPHQGHNITLDYFKAGEDRYPSGNLKGIFYKIRAKNNANRPLYVSLLHLSTQFGVKTIFPCGIIPARSDWIVLDDQNGLAIMDTVDLQVTDLFKVIISTQFFDDFKYQMEELAPPSRSILRREELEDETVEDWGTHTIQVDLIRQQGTLGNRPLKVEGITFAPHPSFYAEVAVSPLVSTQTRGVHPANHLAKLHAAGGVELFTFGKKNTRSVQNSGAVIEFSNVQNIAALKENPLEITIPMSTAEGESVFPVTMKNGFIIPIGNHTSSSNNRTTVHIQEVPVGTDMPPATQAKRSLGRALWFTLLKLGGLKSEAFLLRKVNYRNGAVKRGRLHKTSVKRAKKILIVIHGIIGDTKGMIANLAFLQEQKHYDLVLTFDYENLNTKIENIAATFNALLNEYGIQANDGKMVDILAHSMGGLVSRYLIEFIRKGDNMIDNLYMFGTPNGGSIFGEIPVYRDRLVKLLTVGLNFGKAWLGWVGTVLSVVNKGLIGSKALTITLAQMSTDSAFIDRLKDGQQGHTKYTIIAGDISDYQNIKEARLARFVEAVLLKIGNTANSEQPNDIAVLVEDIRAVPDQIEALKYDVCCHHMNYFDSKEGLLALKEAITSV
ncbi:MAG: caspase family protein [Bacteroidota bacterium]